MTRRDLRQPWFGLALLLATTGCSADLARPTFSATQQATPATGGPAVTSVPTPEGGAAGSGLDTSAPTPTGSPAALTDLTVVPGPPGLSAQVSFSGVVLDQRNPGTEAVFPVIALQSDGQRGLLTVTMPFFLCSGTGPATSAEAGECVPSRVEYGELATPELRLTLDGTRTITVTGDLDTYSSPGNGPRSASATPSWTGHRYQLRITVSPRFPAPGTSDDRTFVAVGTVQLGPYSAREDSSAANIVVLPETA